MEFHCYDQQSKCFVELCRYIRVLNNLNLPAVFRPDGKNDEVIVSFWRGVGETGRLHGEAMAFLMDPYPLILSIRALREGERNT